MFTLLGADQKTYGPATAEQVREWIAGGRANAATLARADAGAEWKPLAAYPEFAGIFTTPAPPPLLPPPEIPPVPLRPKKYSLLLGPVGPMTRQRAWVCATTNFSLPGFGSIFGRRRIGYAQIGVTAVGFALTTFCGISTLLWFSKNWARTQQGDEIPLDELWAHLRWPMLGIALFGFAFLWALSTSLSLLAEARRNEHLNPPARKF